MRKRKKLVLVGIVLGIFLILGFYLLRSKELFLSKRSNKTNVILISIDTLRPDHLKAYGYPKDTSPNITAWAEENAFILQNAYTQTPITYPSFTTLMTGVSPFETRIYNNGRVEEKDGKFVSLPNRGFTQIPNTLPTITSILKKQGYVTAGFGENYVLQNKYTNIGKDFDRYEVFGESNIEEGITNKAIDWMQNTLEKNNPFFLWVHYIDPHEEFTPREENACLFNTQYCSTIHAQTIPSLAQDAKDQSGCHFAPLSYDQVGIQEALYDAEIYQTDHSVGRLLSFIKENDLDKNSIIILYSDHGESFDHNYYFTHSEALYESSLKIMMMLSLPGTKAGGKKVLTPVTNADVFPTLSSLLDWRTSTKNSFSNLLTSTRQEESSSPQDPIFYINENESKFAVREGDYKYIYTIPDRTTECLSQRTEELYNIATDPTESKNLIKEMPSRKDSLKALLLDHLEKSNLDLDITNNLTPQVTKSPADQNVLKTIRDLGY